MPLHTPGPWHATVDAEIVTVNSQMEFICHIDLPAGPRRDANAQLIAATPDLLAAAMKLEEAEEHHANCEECEGEGVPELCEFCFPLFDDARVMRRLAIDKAICVATGEDDHFDEFVGKFEG